MEKKVGDYLFGSEEDALLAQQEIKKIEYLEKKMDFSSPQNIYLVYNKANEEALFKTAVGYGYLRKMRDYLVKCGAYTEDDIPAVRLQCTFDKKLRNGYSPARQRVRPAQKKPVRWPYISVVVNVILAVAVAAMFLIALESNNPNIINYKTQIENQYASWDQELTERERVVKEKERELQIETD